MNASASDPAALLARSARFKLFVMLRHTAKPALLQAHLGDHLRWMIDREKEGSIFLSGPITAGAETARLDGLTVIHAPSLAHAEAIAMQDPFVAAGVVTFELCEWTVNEGAISLTLSLSDTTLVLR